MLQGALDAAPSSAVLPFDTAQAAWLEWIKDAQPGSPIAEGFEESYRVAFMAGWTARGGTSQSEDSPRHQPTCPLQGQSAHPKIVRGVYCQTCLTFTPSETQQALPSAPKNERFKLWGRIRAAIMHAFSQEPIGYEKASANAEWATNKIMEALGFE